MTESFKTTISSTLSRVNDAKNKTYYFAEVVPFIDAQITTNIPRMGIIGAILGSTITTEEELASLQAKYLKIKKTCHKLETQLAKYQSDIQKILNTTSIIRTRLNNFNSILTELAKIIPIVQTIVRIARGIIALQVSVPVAGGVVSGTLIIKQKDIIDRVLAKIEEILALQKIFTPVAGSLIKTAEEIDEVLLPIQNKLTEISVILSNRCRDIDLLFLQTLSQSNLNNNEGVDTTATGEVTFSIDSSFNIEEIIDNLEISSKSKFIEYLTEKGYTGYKITKK